MKRHEFRKLKMHEKIIHIRSLLDDKVGPDVLCLLDGMMYRTAGYRQGTAKMKQHLSVEEIKELRKEKREHMKSLKQTKEERGDFVKTEARKRYERAML